MTDDPNDAPPAGQQDPPATDGPDWKAEARKWEQRAKENSSAAARLQELEDAQKSELQKMQDAIAERDAQLADLPRKARAEAIRFASLATSAGFVDPEDALLNLGDVDLSDGDSVTQALAQLAERKPHLVREQAKTPPRRPKPANGSTPDTGEQSTDKERAAAALRALRTQ